MFKKIGLSLLLVGIFVLGAAGTALAAEGDSADALGGRLIYGQVSQISTHTFIVRTREGTAFNFRVDETTRFCSNVLEDPTFEHLNVGDLVGVAARRPGYGMVPGGLLARIVVILPPDFNPSIRFGVRVRGEALAVDPDAETFTLVKPSGEEMEIQVDERTRYVGHAKDLGDLDVGWVIGVAGGIQGDGSYLAAIVTVAAQLRRDVKTGEVTAVQVGDDTFSIETRQGESVTILVNEDTLYHSREGIICGLDDLQPGMVVGVTTVKSEAGDHLAKRVVAANPDELPKFEVKAMGRVIGIGLDSFTIRPHEGEATTFIIDNQTQFRGRIGRGHGLANLRLGMRLLVGGEHTEAGDLAARLVISR